MIFNASFFSLCLMIAFLVLCFVFSVLVADQIVTLIIFLIYLIILLPIFILMEELKKTLYFYGLESVGYYNAIFLFSTFLIITVGLVLIIQSCYLSFQA